MGLLAKTMNAEPHHHTQRLRSYYSVIKLLHLSLFAGFARGLGTVRRRAELLGACSAFGSTGMVTSIVPFRRERTGQRSLRSVEVISKRSSNCVLHPSNC